jgi:hypothetical protein
MARNRDDKLLTSCDCQWDKYFVPSMCSSSNMIGSEKPHAWGKECDEVMTIPTTHFLRTYVRVPGFHMHVA